MGPLNRTIIESIKGFSHLYVGEKFVWCVCQKKIMDVFCYEEYEGQETSIIARCNGCGMRVGK